MPSSMIIMMFIVGMIGVMRSQTNNSPQWYTAPPGDFRNTSVYQTQSDFFGKHYEASIYGRDLDGVPKWKVGKELPIGLVTLTVNAESAFKKTFPEFNKFKIVSINLVHLPAVDDWVFNMEFNGTDFAQLGNGSFEDKKINVLVLLNGHVFMPTETAK
jgi:hypothetical protein